MLRHNAMYPTNASGEPEFTGQEDFNLLYTAVANMGAASAQREGKDENCFSTKVPFRTFKKVM